MKKNRQMRTNGFIARLFQTYDEGTIIRKQNLRRYVKQKRIYNRISPFNDTTYIDLDCLLNSLNPAKITQQVNTCPRMRTLEQCVKMVQKFDNKKNWVIENFFFTHNGFFKYYYGNKWIVNYDEFEVVYLEHLKQENK